MPTYPSEHGDLYILDDRKQLGYNLDGVNYSLTPNTWYTAAEPIVKGHAVSIGTQAFALAEGLAASDAGKIFQSEQTNTDKCVGIALNGGIYGQQVEVLTKDFYSWQTPSLLIATVSSTANGTITINGVQITSTGTAGSTSLIATNIAATWTALSSTIKNGYTVVANGSNIEISSTTASTTVPTVIAGTITLSSSWYANRTTVTIGWVAEASASRTVLVNGVSSAATITVGTSAAATATSIFNALNGAVTGYTVANPSAGVVTITTTTSTLGFIPTIYVGGSAPFTSATTTLSSTYQYTVFQPSDLGQTVYVAATHQTTVYNSYQDAPTSVTFLVQNNGVAESGSYFVLNGVQAGTINGTNVNSIAATIAALSYTGFTLSNPSANIVTITATNVSHTAPNYFITSFGIGNATYTGFSPNTQLIPTFMDFLPTMQFTTNRTLAAASGAPFIEVGIAKDLNVVFIDFEGDSRGAVNLSQISTTSGEPLAFNSSSLSGAPSVVSIGTDGQAYLADRRKANGGGTQNRNNVAGFLVGASVGFTNYSNPDGTVTVTSGTGTFSSGTIVTSANSSSASIPNTGYVSVTLAGVILTYSYNGYNSGTRTYTVTGQVQGSNTNPTSLAGATVWSGTVPQGTSVVIQKAGIISGFNAALSIGSPVYADFNGGYNQTLNAFSFYTDVVNPLGFATTANSVYVEVGFNTQKTDTGTIGSEYWMSPTATFADYGAIPCTTGLTITGNSGGQAGQLNAFGTTVITAGTGMQTGTYDFTALYAQIGTSYGGYTVWVITNFSAASGTAYLNGTAYAISAPSSNNDLAAKIATAIASSQAGYVCSNPSANFVAITNDPTHLPPNFSITVGTAIATPSTNNGGTTGTTFALPNHNGGTAKFQMRYINNFLYNPPTAPFFRWDSGWTAWGSVPVGCTGVASQYIEIPTTQFGTDIAATEVFAELYVQSTGSSQIFQINPNPINDGAGHTYGYSLSKDIANNLRIDFAANGLAYNTFGGGFANITGLTNPTFRIFVYKIEKFNKFYNHTGDQQLAQLWSLGLVDLLVADTIQGAGYLDRSSTQPVHTTRLNYDGDLYVTDLFISNNFTVSNTTGTSQINGTLIQLRASTASGTQIGGSVNFLTVDNNGNISTPANITTTGSGALTVAGISTFNGATTHNASVSITGVSSTLSVGSSSQLSISAAGTLTTTGNISTTGSGTLSIAGLATFNGNAVITGATASLDDTTASSTFTLFATPTTLNIGNTSASTLTLNNPTLVISATSATMTNGTMTFGNATHAGVLTLSDSTATSANWATITNASSSLTINQKDASSFIYFFTTDNASTNVERLRVTYNEIKVSNIAIGTNTQNVSNTAATLHLQSPTVNDDVGISFDIGVGNYMSKLMFDKTNHRFHFGGGSDGTDGGTVYAGVFNATSKRAIKTNIKKFEERALDIIAQTEVVSFNFKKGPKETRVGFIADDTNGLLAGPEHDRMDLANTLGILLKAVQELKEEIDRLKGLMKWQ